MLELIGASIRWFLARDSTTMLDTRAFLEHIEFLTVRAMHEDFRDLTHVEYDLAVRRSAENMEFKAFSSSQTGASEKYYGAQNMRAIKPIYNRKSYDKVGES